MRQVLLILLILSLMIITASASVSVSKGYGGSGWGYAINCTDKWSCSITGDATVNKFSESGNVTYSVNGARLSMSAFVKKGTNSTAMLSVDALKDGKVIDSKTVNTSYGIVLLTVPYKLYK